MSSVKRLNHVITWQIKNSAGNFQEGYNHQTLEWEGKIPYIFPAKHTRVPEKCTYKLWQTYIKNIGYIWFLSGIC